MSDIKLALLIASCGKSDAMAHLTPLPKYNIEDTNIALLGSDLEKRVLEHAGDKEPAWAAAGDTVGTIVWRIEKFHVVAWPKEKTGSFYDGDSYIVLNTYKKKPDSEELSYNVHFWLGENTTQDEAGTAAYKATELDDHLKGRAVQHREVQGFESHLFLSYFPNFISLRGGVATGFHHVTSKPPPKEHRLYRVTGTTTSKNLVVREVKSLEAGDAYVLDKGSEVWQFNTAGSSGKEKFKASEFARSLLVARSLQTHVKVFEEGGAGAGTFLADIGIKTVPHPPASTGTGPTSLFRLSDESGKITFTSVPITDKRASLSQFSSDDTFLLNTFVHGHQAIFVWIGEKSSNLEKRLGLEYAQQYLWGEKGLDPRTPIIKMSQGHESKEFLEAVGAK